MHLAAAPIINVLFLIVFMLRSKAEQPHSKERLTECVKMLSKTDMRVAQIIPDGPYFFHCPVAKAGTTTVEEFISFYTHTDFKGDRNSHLSSNDRIGVFKYTKDIGERAQSFLCAQKHITFTTVRNPWDRIISGFIDKVLIHRSKAPLRFIENPEDFIGFIEWVTTLNWDNQNWKIGAPKEPGTDHFIPAHTRCSPATMNYTIISKIEDGNLLADLNTALEYLEKLGNVTSSMVKFDQALHRSSITQCATRKLCVQHYLKLMQMSDPVERRKAFFRPYEYTEINRKFWEFFKSDIVDFGYSFGEERIDKLLSEPPTKTTRITTQ